jgi:hypothetical protein
MLSRWFGACCFLLFDLSLQGWGPTSVVAAFFFFFGLLFFLAALRCSAPAPTNRHVVVLFYLSGDTCSLSFTNTGVPTIQSILYLRYDRYN